MKQTAAHLKLKLLDGRVLHFLHGSVESTTIIHHDDSRGYWTANLVFPYCDEVDDPDAFGIGMHLASIVFRIPGVTNVSRTTFNFVQTVQLGPTAEEVEKLLSDEYGWSESDEGLTVHWGDED